MDDLRYQIDLLKAMNQNLTGKEQMYRLVCETSNNAFLYCSFETNEIMSFGKWKDFFGYEVREFNHIYKLYECICDSYHNRLRETLFPERINLYETSCTCLHQDMRTWFIFKVTVEYDENGIPVHKLVTVSDVTKDKRRKEELAYLAYYDTMTGLYNRNYFISRLGEFLDRAQEENDIVSILFIDIDDFRKINDSMGMIVGDEIVQQLGSLLKDIANDKGIIAGHFNSDIYCVAIYAPQGECSAENVAKKIQNRLLEPFQLSNGIEITISVCIGIAEYPEAATSTLELINCAEVVMFRCKSNGKNNILFFDVPIYNDFIYNARLDSKLKEAVLSDNNFILQYQPQYFAGNKKLRGVEALIRWKDTDNHIISPGEFIPIAEKNGTIIQIGNWVLEESIRQYTEWKKNYLQPLILSINISAIQFMREDFEAHLIAVIEKYKVNPKDIEVEVTESVLIEDIGVVRKKLKHLRSYGIRVSIDDFGTGFSSLSYLKELPIDTLKIDKCFIDTVLTDSPTRVITESIIKMVKTLGFEAIAEGVEEEKQYDYLHAIGCDIIQGYYLGKPQSVSDIEKLLKEN